LVGMITVTAMSSTMQDGLRHCRYGIVT